MANSTNASGGGMGLIGVLMVVFVVLKLTGNIEWAWTWVLSPLWIPLAILLAAMVISAVFVILFWAIGKRW